MAKAKEFKRPRAEGWMVYSRDGHSITLGDGEIIFSGYSNGRPATKAEIAAEQAKREARDAERREIDAFRARPEWQDADNIRSTHRNDGARESSAGQADAGRVAGAAN
jgi:hypothetical protein